MRTRFPLIWSGSCGLAAAAVLLTGQPAKPSSCTKPEPALSLGEARTYLQDLVNKDRATLGLNPVEIDPIPTQMAQSHAEEMASHGYLSHWDRQGRPPDQRYTDAGGRDSVQENIYLLQEGGGIVEPVQPEAAPAFSRAEIEHIEAAYFNQRPPDDSHRKNISAAGRRAHPYQR